MIESPAARDIASVLHGQVDLVKHEATGPLIIEHGNGVYVRDIDGNEYLEGMAGAWSTSLGFSCERLVEAAAAQMRRLPTYHTFLHNSNLPMIELAERLLAMAPVPMSKVWFANSGSEANDHMMKFVWYYNNAKGRPDKKKIIARDNSYHGITISSGSLTGLSLFHEGFDLPIKNVLHTGDHDYYRHGSDGESEEDFSVRRAQELEALILKEGPETVAAFVAEPVMAAIGVVAPPRTYFEMIQAVLRKYDVLMVADEVITGFHRTGNTFGCETFGIEPNIMILAKQLSSAYIPISAVMIDEDMYAAIRDYSAENKMFATGFTYSGHPVAAAVALETLKIYEETDIASHVRRIGAVAQERLEGLSSHPLVGEAKGVGLIGAVELVKDKTTRENFGPEVAAFCAEACRRRGLVLRVCAGTRLAFCPPLIIDEDEIALLFDRLEMALDDTLDHVARGPGPEG